MTQHGQPDLGSSSDDYRASHLQRGRTYDATLAAGPFDAYMAQRERTLLRELIPRLFPGGRPRYLDFACGTGRITSTVAPMAGEAVGVDISPSMLDEARRKCPAVRFVQADLTRDAAQLGSFDLVTSFRFFGNAEPALRAAVLRALHGLIRPGGYLVINSHRNPRSIASLLHRASGGGSGDMDLHYGRLRRTLRDGGFQIVQTRPIGAWMYRHGLQAMPQDATRAERLESLFGSPLLTRIAPDAIVVARRLG